MVSRILKLVLGVAFVNLCTTAVCAPTVSPTSGTLQQRPSPGKSAFGSFLESMRKSANRGIDEKKWPLHAAAARGDQRTVESCISSGANPNVNDSDGNSPLYYAADRGHLEMVRYLLDHGADMEFRNSEGHTPLCMAVFQKRGEVVKLLLERGANVNARSKSGGTPFGIAISSGLPVDLFEMLLARGGDLTPEMRQQERSLLHYASIFGRIEMAKTLLARGARISSKDKLGLTPLHLAFAAGEDDMVAFLKARGADDSIQDAFGLTPVQLGALRLEAKKRQLLPVVKESGMLNPQANVILLQFIIDKNGMGLSRANGAAIGDGSVIVTAAHVVGPSRYADEDSSDGLKLKRVYAISSYRGDACEPEILALDKEKDLALLKAPWGKHPAFSLASQEDLARAKEMAVVGYPPTEKKGNISGGLPKQIMMEQLPVLKVLPEDNLFRIADSKGTDAIGIILGGARFMRPGWSGSPIVLPGSGLLAGVYAGAAVRFAPKQKQNSAWDMSHTRGASALSIRSLLQEHAIAAECPAPEEYMKPPADAGMAFDTLLDLVDAVQKGDDESANNKTKELSRMRPRSTVWYLLMAWLATNGAKAYKDDPKCQNALVAETCFKSALTLSPKSALAHAGYGHFLYMMGREKEAIVEFDKYLALRPDEPFVQSEKKAAQEMILRKTIQENKAKPEDPMTSRSIEELRRSRQGGTHPARNTDTRILNPKSPIRNQ